MDLLKWLVLTIFVRSLLKKKLKAENKNWQ